MPGFHLHRSNRLESLAGTLADRVRTPLQSALAPETVLVQSQGMARWLKLQLAERLGVAANLRFPFPRAFAHELFRALDLTVDARPSFDPELLVWRLYSLLPGAAQRPGFDAVARYLADGDDRKRFQLAGRLARLFDQYLVYRPDLIQAWDADDANWPEAFQAEARDAWQAQLWHLVGDGWAVGHPAAWHCEFLRRAQAGDLPADRLPERVSLFGVSALPPFHLDLLAALGTVAEVHLFLLQPTEHYWGDLRSRREQALARRRSPRSLGEADEGHPLLASLGRTGREMLDLLLDRDAQDAVEDFVAPPDDRLLGRLQGAMLSLTARGAAEPRLPLAHIDDSVRVHSCHSPLREVEVLHDHLLAWFSDDPQLQPRDVIVMVPDLETYAPLLEAVLAQPEQPGQFIPFSIADRSPRAGGLGAALWHALELAGSPFAAPEVFGLLERPPVRQRFGLDEDALDRCRDWVRAAEIRWGRDEAHTHAQSATANHTWRAGLDRLLLSFALGGTEELVACGVARSVSVDGGEADVLGGVCQFAETLLNFARAAETPAPPAEWAERLNSFLGALCVTEGDAKREADTVRAALTTLADAQKWGGCTEPLSLSVVLEHLGPALAEDRRGSGFLHGGVTICGLKPMRSVPFAVVCLLGLNHGTFPRQNTPLAFDLTARHRRAGDSSPRDDDRYLFLETLLSARARLHLSYVGQSQRDGKDIPPSVVVSELLDHFDHEFTTAAGTPPSRELVVRHRLQAFSPDYFRGEGLFSFSPANHAAAVALQERRQEPIPPLAGKHPAESPTAPVELSTLIRFFRNPAQHFAEQRLGLRFARAEDALRDEEDFQVGTRDNHSLVEAGVATLRRHQSLRELLTLQAAAGRLPDEPLRKGEQSRLERETTAFWQRCEPHFAAPARFLAGTLTVAGWELTGRVEVFGDQVVLARYSKLDRRPETFLAGWINLLFAASLDASVCRAVLLGRDGTFALNVPADSAAELGRLVTLFQRGQGEVLPFAAKTSFAYAEKFVGKVKVEAEREDRALAAARNAWAPPFVGDDRPDPESTDAALRLAFDGVDLSGVADFGAVSLTVFQALLQHREELP